MGLLDDLKSQADTQREGEQADEARLAERERVYREDIQPRMVTAYQFFIKMVEQLNYLKMETRVDYPLLPEGKMCTLLQDDYKVVIDSSKNLKQIDLNFQCSLDKPLDFEIIGKDAVLSHCDRLDRYYFKYERKIKKDGRLEIESARFRIEGPLPMKVALRVDVDKGVIMLVLRNFTDPGVSQYVLKPEQLDEAFQERLGKFVLRQETSLFEHAISDDAREMLRKKIQAEQVLREQELKEAEERIKAEEAAEKENSKKEQFKKAVNTVVSENKEKLKKAVDEQVNDKKEKLKAMFNKLKDQAGFNKR